MSGWINRYFFFKVTDFLFGLLFLSIVFLTIFYSKIRIKKKVKKEVIYIYLVIGILLIEWFTNHPSLRYGGYSLFFIFLFIPISLVLERYKNNINLVKKKTFIILLIGISIFVLRNIDRINNESKKYDYKVFFNPYHKIDSTYFRFENQTNELIKNFDDCQIKKKSCSKQNQFIIKKKLGKYIFIRNK